MKRARSFLAGLGLALLALVAQLAVANLPALARPDSNPVLAQLVALQTLCHVQDIGIPGSPAHPVPLHNNDCAICVICAGVAGSLLAAPVVVAGAPMAVGTPTRIVAFWPPAAAPPPLRVRATGARAPPALV